MTNPSTPSSNKAIEEILDKKRTILMDMLGGILQAPRKEASVDLWKLHIDAALDRLDNEVYEPYLTSERQNLIGKLPKLKELTNDSDPLYIYGYNDCLIQVEARLRKELENG